MKKLNRNIKIILIINGIIAYDDHRRAPDPHDPRP